VAEAKGAIRERWPRSRWILTEIGTWSTESTHRLFEEPPIRDRARYTPQHAGVAIFGKLHSRAYDDEVILTAFDLLELDGEDWRVRPLEGGKAQLATFLTMAEGDAAAILAQDQEPDGAPGTVAPHGLAVESSRMPPAARSRAALISP
jgi:hypothetical protein